MNRYIVHTHCGDFVTVAKTERGARNNVRYRLFGRVGGREYAQNWTVVEAD